MLYSMKMRAAQGGDHKLGGMHISGAERILAENELLATANAMIMRAFKHSRGKADFINLKIEAVDDNNLKYVKLLPIVTHESANLVAGRAIAAKLLKQSGVSDKAICRGFDLLDGLVTSMRGAMLVDAVSGKRLDDLTMRGVRVSNMDIADAQQFKCWLRQQNLTDIHVREAMVLATKVAFHPDVVAELCWSDDPEYITGYVADKKAYQRITRLKELGNWQGGRIFFIRPTANLKNLLEYLEQQTVLVVGGEA